jgi:hypothetical protein
MNVTRHPRLFHFRFWGSLYGRHLQGWLEYFDPRQFYVIPYLRYMRTGGREAVFAELSEWLGITFLSQTEGGDDASQASQSNEGVHPPLDKDLSPAVLAEFKEMIAPENRLLVQLLASGSLSGLQLARYNGTIGSEVDTKAWLEAGW